MLCGLLCFVAVLVSGDSLPRHATPSPSPMGVRAISIFYQFIQFLEAVADGEVERMFTFISSSHLLLARQSTLRASVYACLLPAQLVRSSTATLRLP